MLSIQGTIRNTGDPVVTVIGRIGDSKQGETGARNLNDSRGSDSLIVVMNPAKV